MRPVLDLLILLLGILNALLNLANALAPFVKEGSRPSTVLVGILALLVLLAALPFYLLWIRGQKVAALVSVGLLLAGAIAVMVRVTIVDTARVYEFERTCEGWGGHPEGGLQQACLGAKISPKYSHKGGSSLEFTSTDVRDEDAYVTVPRDPGRPADTPRSVTAWVFVPREAGIAAGAARSTVKVILWDKDGGSHESGFTPLNPGQWQTVSWDLPDQGWPEPWQEVGLHFYLLNDYNGPVYIDDVTVQ